MATIDVAGSVLPVYTPTLPVTTDTSVLTQADLTALTLSLANRIEFLRDLVDDASNRPDRSLVLREDFNGAIWDPTGSRLDAEFPWRTGHVGSPSVSNTSAITDAPGELTVQIAAPSEEFRFHYGAATDQPFTFASTQHLTIRARLTDDPGNLNTFMQIGLAQNVGAASGGTNCIALLYQKGVDPVNWLLHVRKASVSSFIPIATFVDGVYFTVRFVKVGTDMQVLNKTGALLHTIVAADIPTTACTLGGYFINSVADPNLAKYQVDFLFLRNRPSQRQ